MPEGSSAGLSPSRLGAYWQHGAQRRGAMAHLLWPLAQIYGALSSLRRALYARGLLEQQRMPVPVIVIGNLVVGGAGKTPTTISLVQHLVAQGWRPGVVSRGYGREHGLVTEVGPDTPTQVSGDEPALIRLRTGVPVFVAAKRVDAARALLQAHPLVDVLVCDDGLQHLALARDLAVAVFDDRGAGNGWLLPAGLLREPWPPHAGSTGNRPDLVLRQARTGHESEPMPVPQGLPRFVAGRRLADRALGPDGQSVALTALHGQALTAIAGIARPEVFFDMLRERGLTLGQTVPLADHAPPQAIAAAALAANHPIVCTEKDAVKLFALARTTGQQAPAMWAVPLELHPEPAFFDAIDDLLTRRCHVEPDGTRTATPSEPESGPG
nr:putative tetraacyldisaccharide 4'-kinase [uncultured bacterium]